MLSTDKVKEILKKFGPQTAEGIAGKIVDSTGKACDTADVEDALDKLGEVNEISLQGTVYSVL